MRRETKEKIGIALMVGGGVAIVAALTPCLSSTVLGIGATEILMHCTIGFAVVAVVKGVAGFGVPHLWIAAGIGGAALLACLIAGAYMVPTELLKDTLSGRFLITAGMDPCKLELGHVIGVDIGILAAGILVGSVAIWAGWTLMNSQDAPASMNTHDVLGTYGRNLGQDDTVALDADF